MQVALAGAPPTLSKVLRISFSATGRRKNDDEGGEEEEEAEEGTTGAEILYSQSGSAKPTATSSLPLHLQSVRGITKTVMAQASGTDTDKEKEGSKQHINPAITKATIFKLGPVKRSWSHTRLAKEFQPTKEGGR